MYVDCLFSRTRKQNIIPSLSNPRVLDGQTPQKISENSDSLNKTKDIATATRLVSHPFLAARPHYPLKSEDITRVRS